LDSITDGQRNFLLARKAIDVLKQLDVEDLRMRYCFQEFREVFHLANSIDKQELKDLAKSYIGMNIFIQGIVKQIETGVSFTGKTVVVDTKYHPRFAQFKIVDKNERS
jgi:hypothetical protein